MANVLVDTDVISYIFKEDSRGLAFLDLLDGQDSFYSFQTFAELRLWSIEHRWSIKRWHELLAHLEGYTLIEHTPFISEQWALVMDNARKAGRRMLAADAWIAATALDFEAPLVTHNIKDFLGIKNLEIISIRENS